MRQLLIEKRKELINQFCKCPASKFQKGSLVGKYPVELDGGKTVIYISDKSREEEIKRNYELRMKR
ncbi:MAG: hypothetical protein WCI71_19210 [Bacteroidota bacterium]